MPSLRMSSISLINQEIHNFYILENHTDLGKNNEECFDESLRVFDGDDCRNLYVFQHEMAIVRPTQDKVQYILTDDTTTCITVIIRHIRSGVTCLIHADDLDYDDETLADVQELFRKIHQIASQTPPLPNTPPEVDDKHFQVSLFGGYNDERGTSRELFVTLLRLFNSLNDGFIAHLHCCYTGSLNTTWKTATFGPKQGLPVVAPKIYGAAIHVPTGRMFNAVLDHSRTSNIPLPMLRRALFTTWRTFFTPIYDTLGDSIRFDIRQFHSSFPYMEPYFREAANRPDDDILLKSSTSPYVEPEHFVDDYRAVHSFYAANCTKDLTEMFFPGGRARRFVVCDNRWTDAGAENNV